MAMFRPRSRITVLLCMALPWLAMLGFARRDDPSTWSNAHWTAWRNAQVNRILTPTYLAGNEKLLMRTDVSSRCAEAYNSIANSLADPSFISNKDRAAILGRFVQFITAQRWMALKGANGAQTNALGMNISDAEYWEYARPYTTLPDLLKSRAFLELMEHRGTYNYAVDVIDAHNATLPSDQKWLVLPFRGQFVASVDRTTFARLLVVAPNQAQPDGRKLDQWVSFAIARPEMEPEPVTRSVSVVAVVHDPAGSAGSKAYFTDYFREFDGATNSITPKPTFLMTPNPSQNCYDCHKSAVIPIRPKATYAFEPDGQMVEAGRSTELLAQLDKLIGSYGESDLGHMITGAFGPSLGAAATVRSDEFIAGATADHPIPANSYAAIKENMNCASCHDGFGRLNYLIGVRSDGDIKSFEAKHGLVQSFIEQGFMPPGNTLSPVERHALWECVSKEYFDPATGTGAFVDWLKGSS